MRRVFAREPFEDLVGPSIFLAGPTPRSADVPSWRPKAFELLEELGFEGTVFAPEDSKFSPRFDYMDQVEWEEAGLTRADVIVFWVPRELKTMPGFTTNIEWGRWCDSGKVVLGAPVDAPKLAYMRYYATKLNVPQADTLKGTLQAALQLLPTTN